MDLSKTGVIGVLAWIIRHFVPLVADDPKLFWGSMLARMPLKKYLSMTDLVFAILVLEHHMMKWRHLIHFQLETGRSPSEDFTQQSGGLLYRDGIAGEAAKQRFEDLYVYFSPTSVLPSILIMSEGSRLPWMTWPEMVRCPSRPISRTAVLVGPLWVLNPSRFRMMFSTVFSTTCFCKC